MFKYLLMALIAVAKYSLCSMVFILGTSWAQAAPTVEGYKISWPSDGWYQVQRSSDQVSICNGGDSCDVPAGTYIVINHDTHERFLDVVVPQFENSKINRPFQVVDGAFVFSSDVYGWYQVQDAVSFASLCETTPQNPCPVGPGLYKVINHTTGQVWDDIRVPESSGISTEQGNPQGTDLNAENYLNLYNYIVQLSSESFVKPHFDFFGRLIKDESKISCGPDGSYSRKATVDPLTGQDAISVSFVNCKIADGRVVDGTAWSYSNYQLYTATRVVSDRSSMHLDLNVKTSSGDAIVLKGYSLYQYSYDYEGINRTTRSVDISEFANSHSSLKSYRSEVCSGGCYNYSRSNASILDPVVLRTRFVVNSPETGFKNLVVNTPSPLITDSPGGCLQGGQIEVGADDQGLLIADYSNSNDTGMVKLTLEQVGSQAAPQVYEHIRGNSEDGLLEIFKQPNPYNDIQESSCSRFF